MNSKKVVKVIGNVSYWLFMITTLICVVIVIAGRASGGEPNIFGYQIKTVLSGSMEPTFQTGSVIAVQKLENPTDLTVGDVITFQESRDVLVTHRIIDVNTSNEGVLYKTKGDNNNFEDTNPVLSQNVVAVYSGFTLPKFGYFLNYATSPIGTAILLIIPGLILLGYATVTIRQAIKEIEGKMQVNTKESDVIEEKIS
ncbi:signal peptidase I SipW [Sutcliffiella horikoshii]|uniref:signal peptidase I SipW n=1 Tax=Sutcliffiella horikoshii TaxID=79883 RepID=UPI001EEE9318|nr:signal peptidase I [Sutcliffiella horikoshii]MCG1021657.1 signal peptidase I [Sutcliffiella horikoshii]